MSGAWAACIALNGLAVFSNLFALAAGCDDVLLHGGCAAVSAVCVGLCVWAARSERL